MDVSIMLEQVAGNGFRATALMPTPLVGEGPTRDEAVKKVRALIEDKLSGAELLQIEVPAAPSANPWLAIAGTWRDHPDVDDVVEDIRQYRDEVNAATDRL